MTVSRREFLYGCAALASGVWAGPLAADAPRKKAQIAITLDLEMSSQYPRRDMMEWNFEKGNLDEATKQYSVEAARIVKESGGVLHFFCVGRVLEQPNIDWLKGLAASGHPIGNHTYDHVNVTATKPEQTQFRFQRAPWLVEGKTARQIVRENIILANVALRERAGITANGFRTPGGFAEGLTAYPDVQQMLLDLGFDWVSSKYPSHGGLVPKEEPSAEGYASILKAQPKAQPFVYPSGLVEVPMNPISDVSAFRTLYWKLDYFLKAIRQGVEWAIATGGVFDFLAHPSCLVVEDPQHATIKLICELVKQSADRASIVDLGTIARQIKPPS